MDQLQARVNEQKILTLEQSVVKLSGDIRDVHGDVRQVHQELTTWFDRLEQVVEDLRIQNVKVQEQMASRTILEKTIEEQLDDAKKFYQKITLALFGGGFSLVVFIIQNIIIH